MEDSKTLIVFFKTPISTRRNVLEIHKDYMGKRFQKFRQSLFILCMIFRS